MVAAPELLFRILTIVFRRFVYVGTTVIMHEEQIKNLSKLYGYKFTENFSQVKNILAVPNGGRLVSGCLQFENIDRP